MSPQYHWAIRHYGAHIILRYIGSHNLTFPKCFCSSTVDGDYLHQQDIHDGRRDQVPRIVLGKAARVSGRRECQLPQHVLVQP